MITRRCDGGARVEQLGQTNGTTTLLIGYVRVWCGVVKEKPIITFL